MEAFGVLDSGQRSTGTVHRRDDRCLDRRGPPSQEVSAADRRGDDGAICALDHHGTGRRWNRTYKNAIASVTGPGRRGHFCHDVQTCRSHNSRVARGGCFNCSAAATARNTCDQILSLHEKECNGGPTLIPHEQPTFGLRIAQACGTSISDERLVHHCRFRLPFRQGWLTGSSPCAESCREQYGDHHDRSDDHDEGASASVFGLSDSRDDLSYATEPMTASRMDCDSVVPCAHLPLLSYGVSVTLYLWASGVASEPREQTDGAASSWQRPRIVRWFVCRQHEERRTDVDKVWTFPLSCPRCPASPWAASTRGTDPRVPSVPLTASTREFLNGEDGDEIGRRGRPMGRLQFVIRKYWGCCSIAPRRRRVERRRRPSLRRTTNHGSRASSIPQSRNRDAARVRT